MFSVENVSELSQIQRCAMFAMSILLARVTSRVSAEKLLLLCEINWRSSMPHRYRRLGGECLYRQTGRRFKGFQKDR
ncbi:hypothetical protein BJX68DRAFT_11690 [Aspergillus pseudodeflectus]|uniref:Uncharacterized protein n=1 Tax=Aspergillus pseudodeflectus TaxID=176178 RepID=A0ABR4LB67_9EURO